MRLCPVSQLSFSALMGIGASPGSRCATGIATVKTDRMNWTVGGCLRAATTSVMTKPAAFQKPFSAMAREIVPMAQMKTSAVGDDRFGLI